MRPGLQPGLHSELRWPVTFDRAIGLADGRLPVFSTPSMINLMEHAAREVLRPFLESEEESVGIDVNVKHLAATPLGAAVRGVAEVTAIQGRQIDFDITAFDADEPIGAGKHRRAVVSIEKMAQRLQQKGASPMAVSAMVSQPLIQPSSSDLPPLSAVQVRVQEKIAWVTLNRPVALNAISPQMCAELEIVLAWMAGHPDEIRVAILTGAGKAFCAGDDLKQMLAHSPQQAAEWNVSEARLFMAFERIPQPLIAAINGPCFGGGVVVACACDFRIASRAATFGMPEVNLGWPPSFAIPQLAAVVGKPKALELCLQGRTIAAQEALSIGLLNELVAPNLLARSATALARELLQKPPAALRITRQLMHRILPGSTPFTETLTNEAYLKCLATTDSREGLSAFIEKRKPKFTGK